MNKYFFGIILLVVAASAVQAQVGINILQPDTSAILHLESTDRGFLPPRMTTAQRDSIFAPKAGLMIYNAEDSVVQYYTGECWLNAWQKKCEDCILDFTIERNNGSIDRVVSNDDSVALYINQVNGNQSTAVYILPNLPDGMTASLNQTSVNGSDTVMLNVNASIFTAPGTYPVVVQAICGSNTYNQVFVVTVDPCIEIDVTTPQSNYDLQAINSLPSNQPICVVLRLAPGVQMTNDSLSPILTTGNLHPQSKVGIENNTDLFAKGGAGGSGAGLQGQTGEGGDGTDAIDLTVHTHIINNGRIFGGGGGGGSVGFEVSVPVVGSLGVGAGGGGGAQGGVGGNTSVGILYEPGQDATTGVNGQGGAGGLLNVPVSIPIGPATVDITPNAFGGDGGDYGVNGGTGFLFVNVQVSVPFVGTVFNQDFPNPPSSNFPAGGEAGFAIKRNGNTLIGVADGNYQTSNIKGEVGN